MAACGFTACKSPSTPAPPPAASPAKPAPPAKNAEPKVSNQPRGPIAFDHISSYPRPSSSPPSALSFDPEGDSFVYLLHPSDSLENTLYQQGLSEDKATPLVLKSAQAVREEDLSPEEKLRRERSRQITVGVTSYRWSPAGSALMVPSRGDLYLKKDRKSDFSKRFDSKGSPAIDPQWSPDGKSIAFVQNKELHVIDAWSSVAAKALTSGAEKQGVTHGLAEYIAQEELDRGSGFWWSKDSRRLAYTRVDESKVPNLTLVHLAQEAKKAPSQAIEKHRYAYAGQSNAKVELGVISAKGGRTTWLNLEQSFGKDFYLARVKWLSTGELAVVLLNRAQDAVELRIFDPANGRSRVLLKESGKPWLNLHHMFKEIEKGEYKGNYIWASERSGYQHLYLVGKDGEIIRPLTQGPWVVTALNGVDGEKGKLWFTATKNGPTQRQLYSVSLSGGPIEQITKDPGTHNVSVDAKKGRFIDSFSNLETAPEVTLRDLSNNKVVSTIYTEDPRAAQELKLMPPRIVKIRSRDGDELFGMLYTPDPKVFGKGPYPTIISVYGGPHAQLVRNSWGATVSMREQFLAQNGYTVLRLDNRGSGNRGLEFESKVAHNLGDLEVKDQVDGVQWLVKEGLTDANQVGIIGWSYGGYMSAMALVRAPEVFHAGVAGAPVTDWHGYDTAYTERYMGHPEKNVEGYKSSSVMTHIDKLKGRLMLVHGLVDENVHFRHTAELMNAITGANKDYDLLLYPDERHRPRRPADRLHMERRVFEFFNKYVKGRPTSKAAAR